MLLAAEDVESIGAALEPGSIAAVLVWENVWAASRCSSRWMGERAERILRPAGARLTGDCSGRRTAHRRVRDRRAGVRNRPAELDLAADPAARW